jgi:hypothetical protein
VKRLIISLAIVLALILTLAAPAFATGGSHVWYLQNTTMAVFSPPQTYEVMKLVQNETGSISMAAGSTLTWITNVPAGANVTYPNDFWTLRLQTDSDWGSLGSGCVALIGYVDNTSPFFHSLGNMTPVTYEANNGILELKGVPALGETIPAGTYMALKINNNTTIAHNVFCGYRYTPNGQLYTSCMSTPQSDPGYPLPEMAAGILLGAGLLGVGGFMFIRRRNAADNI